jgi:lipid-binding SYLF domain-containing protein
MLQQKHMYTDFTIRCGRPLLVALLFATLISPIGAADKAKDEETLKNAADVLSQMLSSNNIPSDVLERADCVLVLPDVKKFGFGVGGSGGRGPMTCRSGSDFSGQWSAPAMYSMGGASLGLQVGGSSSDFVLLIMSQKGVNAIMEGKTKLGSNATAAAGPSGATTTGMEGTDILTYAKASGLFAGASLGSATIEPDNDANKRLYNQDVSAKEIIMTNSVRPTPAGEQFVSQLSTKLSRHK